MLPPCQDHKRIFDGDQGPNTGGMGAFGPLPFLRGEDLARLTAELVEPTIRGLREDGLSARGVLFLGVMWTPRGPRLLEYNVRFGDPETQVLMELLDEDLATLLLEVAQGRLRRAALALRAGLRHRRGAGGRGLSRSRPGWTCPSPSPVPPPRSSTPAPAGARTGPGAPMAAGC